jgi:hypothetical protein
MSKDKGKALERLTEGDDYNYKIRNMIDEIRMWKEKIRHRQEVYERNEETLGLQTERMANIEKDNQKLMAKIQSMDKGINVEPTKAKQSEKVKAMEEIKKNKEEAKEKYDRVKENNEKELKQAEKELKEITTQRDALYTKVKELDQENRISTLKLREVGRVLKHNQLKPISPVRNNGLLTSKRSDVSSKHSMSKRSSTSNLIATKKSIKNTSHVIAATKGMKKGVNTKSTQLLNKKEYAKPKNEDSDEDLEKNQIIDYEKFKKQQNDKNSSNLAAIKGSKGQKQKFETKANLK